MNSYTTGGYFMNPYTTGDYYVNPYITEDYSMKPYTAEGYSTYPYIIGKKLAEVLDGRTCFTSRIKERDFNGYLATLHSLVYKVLRKSNTYNDRDNLQNKLLGKKMYDNVVKATSDIGDASTSKIVLDYYYGLRLHQNYGPNLNSLNNGSDFLEKYQSLKGDAMDWEESMQLATWYLKNDIVDSLENFNYDNIILFRPELLDKPWNRNARDFFQALCQWSERHTNLNIYYIYENGEIYHLADGEYKLIYINLEDDWQIQSSSFSFIG